MPLCERAAQASLPFRPEGQRNRMRVATAVSPFVGFEQSPRPAAQGRWEVWRSCGWLPLRFRRVCRTSRSPAVGCRLPNSQTTAGILGLPRLPRNPFFLSVCMRFRLLLQTAIHARRGFSGDVFERLFVGSPSEKASAYNGAPSVTTSRRSIHRDHSHSRASLVRIAARRCNSAFATALASPKERFRVRPV